MEPQEYRSFDPREYGGGGGTVYQAQSAGGGNNYGPVRKKHTLRNILIFLLIVALVIGAAWFFGSNTTGTREGNVVTLSDKDELKISEPYIGRIYIDGAISGADATTATGYRHQWLLSMVTAMKNDENNRGIILWESTPGGSVYQTDELYLALKDYQKTTGRPIYTYMADEAASGGYYLASLSDKIYANPNCWTGSIGVTLGSIYDLTGLMDKLGVKAVTVHAGRNKLMGSETEVLTEEQQEILQSLVDESYDRFVDIVAEGRHMDRAKAEKLADGRIYTALQAKKNGLIDEIGTEDDAVRDMQTTHKLEGVNVISIQHTDTTDPFMSLFGSAFKSNVDPAGAALDQLDQMLALNGKVELSYIAAIHKS